MFFKKPKKFHRKLKFIQKINFFLNKKIHIFKPKNQELPLPLITLPYDKIIKKQQKKFLLTFLIFLAFSTFYTYFFIQEKIKNEQLITILAFSENLKFPKEIKKTDTKKIQIQQKNLPENIIKNFKEIEGKTLIQNVVKNEILLPHHFQKAINPDSISSKFTESFAFSLEENWLESDLPQIYKNDRIDILVSNNKKGISETLSIVTNLEVIEVQKNNRGKQILVINCTEKEAQSILFSRGLRLPMQVLIHSSLPNKTETIITEEVMEQ